MKIRGGSIIQALREANEVRSTAFSRYLKRPTHFWQDLDLRSHMLRRNVRGESQ